MESGEYSGEIGGSGGVAIVANPYSGSRRNPARVKALAAELARIGVDVRMMWERDELREAARQPDFAGRFSRIIAAGGDGTLHAIVNTPGVLASGAAIAHFPLGTENLFAKEFGYTRDVPTMAQIIARGKCQPLDVGTASYPDGSVTRFTIVASAGFDAEVIHRLELWRSRTRSGRLRRVRRLSYMRPVLSTAASYAYPELEVQVDGRTWHAPLCMVFNLPRYGMNLGICPDAKGDDGWLDYAIFENAGASALMSYALSITLGRHHKRTDVQCGRARSIRIRGVDCGVPLEIDGEGAGFVPVDIGIEPGAMNVLAPA